MEKLKKILPVSNPLINYIPPVDMIFSLISTDPSRLSNNWLENYIKIEVREPFLKTDNPTMEFDGFKDWRSFDKGFSIGITPKEYIQENLIEWIIHSIDIENYCFYDHNTYYVSEYSNYHQYKDRHEIFIYGYDKNKNLFKCLDYFDFRHYTSKWIPFNEIFDAYYRYNELEVEDYIGGILTIKLKKYPDTKVNFNKIKYDLITLIENDFIAPKFKRVLYGFCYFDELETLITQTEKADGLIDVKFFTFIYSHIYLMQIRCRICFSAEINEKFEKAFQNLLVRSKNLEMMFLKTSLKFRSLNEGLTLKARKTFSENIKYIKKEYRSLIYEIIEYFDCLCN